MIKELLINLINAPSTDKTGELEAAQVLHKAFVDNDIQSQLDVWDDNRANVTATVKGTGEKPALIFASHIDVVPAGEKKWKTPPFQATEIDGKIFGRGSCDMKAGNAAAAVAAINIKNSGVKLKGDLLVTSTAGEETDSCGAFKFLEKYKTGLGHVAGIILPEPTNFEIINAHRGICWLKITTHGQTAHGSMPQLGINAIDKMMVVADALKDYKFPNVADPLDKPSLSINQFHAGKATNVIPDKCFIEVDIRINANIQPDEIITEISNILKEIKHADADLKVEIEPIRKVAAMFTDPENQFVKTVCRSADITETKSVGYTTDGPIFKKICDDIVVFGPGKSKLAHQPDEYIDTADLDKAVKIYEKIIIDILT